MTIHIHGNGGMIHNEIECTWMEFPLSLNFRSKMEAVLLVNLKLHIPELIGSK